MVICRFPSIHEDNLARVRCRLRSTTAVSAILAAYAWCAPQAAQADCAPAPTSGGTVTCTGNPSGFTASGLTSLTVNAQNTNFNGTFSALSIGTLGVNSTNTNFQAVTFTDVGNLTFLIDGGNLNGPLTVSNGGTVTIDANANLPAVTLDVSNRLSLTIQPGRAINNGLTITGAADTEINVGSGAFINTMFSIAGDGAHTITNAGTLNNGIVLTGNGSSSITNLAGATINDKVQSTGSSTDTVTIPASFRAAPSISAPGTTRHQPSGIGSFARQDRLGRQPRRRRRHAHHARRVDQARERGHRQ